MFECFLWAQDSFLPNSCLLTSPPILGTGSEIGTCCQMKAFTIPEDNPTCHIIVLSLAAGLLSSSGYHSLPDTQQLHRLRHAARPQGREGSICTPSLPAYCWGKLHELFSLTPITMVTSSIRFTSRLKSLFPYKVGWLL